MRNLRVNLMASDVLFSESEQYIRTTVVNLVRNQLQSHDLKTPKQSHG